MTDNIQPIDPFGTPEPAPLKTWEDVRKHRDAMLLETEREYNFDSPESIKQAWRAYKQALRDLPDTYKDLEDLNQIEWPEAPKSHIQELMSSR